MFFEYGTFYLTLRDFVIFLLQHLFLLAFLAVWLRTVCLSSVSGLGSGQ